MRAVVDYYERVLNFFAGSRNNRAAALADVQTFYRLFTAPGVAHCGRGNGPNEFDMQSALEEWVEQNRAPASVIAIRRTNGQQDWSRPLCPYPKMAVYKGKGDTNDALNFECRE